MVRVTGDGLQRGPRRLVEAAVVERLAEVEEDDRTLGVMRARLAECVGGAFQIAQSSQCEPYCSNAATSSG